MKEIVAHSIYEMLQTKYEKIGCDYVILSSDEEYMGMETHKKAVLSAFEILGSRFSEYGIDINIEPNQMIAYKSSVAELLEVPPDAYFDERKKTERNYSVDFPIPYWYAFLEPPYGTPYRKADFMEFNDVLLPNRNGLEVYRWNDGFSNYFDAGKEWWGTGLWSIYDSKTDTFIIIGASLTD